jgi:hypothetical protein
MTRLSLVLLACLMPATTLAHIGPVADTAELRGASPAQLALSVPVRATPKGACPIVAPQIAQIQMACLSN